MSVNLKKGEKINLTKDGGQGLRSVMVGLGWDEAPRSGGFLGLFKPQAIDCDASVILCGADGKVIDPRDVKQSVVYFGNLTHPSGAIVHQGDNLTGAGEGDDEQVRVDLQAIPAGIERVVFVITIYEAEARRQNFGQVSNAFIRVVDEATGAELVRYDLEEDFSIETALVAGELYRHNGEWKFNAVGSGFQGGLEAACRHYGVNV